jgi:serine/threonine-protein kinase RsbT
MPVIQKESLSLISEQDIVAARQQIRKVSQQIGFNIVDQTKIVTAASELARNAVVYGGGGILEWETIDQNGRTGLRLTVSDQGPGIEDLTLAMKDGWTSGKGMGLGLPGTKRLVSDFSITSERGVGTKVIVTRWK